MQQLFYVLNGSVSVCIYFINTVICVTPLLFFSVCKLIPIRPWQTLMSKTVDAIATLWIGINNLNQKIFSRTRFTLNASGELRKRDWYLVIANHQSWVDILTLQRVFNRKVPFLKFFLKQNLIFVPFLGLAWWGLDFPFMKRYSKSFLAKNPHLKGKDLETTKKACEKFRNSPVSIMNFVEGTRFSPKKLPQNSAFKRLLPPKSGGIAFVMSAMGERLNKLINVTIYYPGGIPSFWDFVCGKVKNVIVDVDTIEINQLKTSGIFNEGYFTDENQKQKFQQWLNQLWLQKEDKLLALEKEHESSCGH
ncbi:acyltransferase [Glaciecola sp. 1036]|uniref:acyltransferase n=1 Tax=Alteromonadaceae TaxID=72275 RepID=UPI003D029346